MKLLTPPLIALTGTALLGAVLAAHVLRGRFAHWSLSPVHALLGVTGLSLLLTPLTQGVPPPQVWAGFGLLCAAGGLGLVLAIFHLRQRLPPKALVLLHASCAIAGLGTLFHAAVTT